MAALKLRVGDDETVRFTITDADSNAIDITGGTIKFKIAQKLSVTDANAEYFASYTGFTDPTNGIHDEVITDATTGAWTPGRYKYQVRFLDSAGNVISEDVDDIILEQNLIENE